MAEQTIRWGILGTGGIARKFAAAIHQTDGAELAAVGSRTKDRAEAFAREHGASRAHGTYEALAEDGGVDVVYIATPHPAHADNALLCINAGKAVLVEKPFTLNAEEAERVVSAAREAGVFAMEAMWARFIPVHRKLREMLAAGVIGEVKMVEANFGFRIDWDPKSRLLDRSLGGGALLDAGVYPIAFTSMVLGSKPLEVLGLPHIGETGVDEQDTMVFRYEGGQLAWLACAVRTKLPTEATVCGTEGRIRVDDPFFCARGMTHRDADGKDHRIEPPFEGNGYSYEVAEVGRCLRAGETESDLMPLDESVAIMRIMDRLRGQWDLTYPSEEEA